MVRRHAASYARTAAYFRDHGVRVVNMSERGWGLKEIEGILRVQRLGGLGRGALARGGQAAGHPRAGPARGDRGLAGDPVRLRRGQRRQRRGLRREHPGLVHAAQPAGRRRGRPGRRTDGLHQLRRRASGSTPTASRCRATCRAAAGCACPAHQWRRAQACNLAAKLLARAPALTPVEVVELIERGGVQEGGLPAHEPEVVAVPAGPLRCGRPDRIQEKAGPRGPAFVVPAAARVLQDVRAGGLAPSVPTPTQAVSRRRRSQVGDPLPDQSSTGRLSRRAVAS